jgi:hypothetical protein
MSTGYKINKSDTGYMAYTENIPTNQNMYAVK